VKATRIKIRVSVKNNKKERITKYGHLRELAICVFGITYKEK